MLAVMRYVERNALRANLVRRVQVWRWGSAAWRERGDDLPQAAPSPLPSDWPGLVNEPQTEKELDALRRSVNRKTPFGHERWQRRAAERLGLEHTLRPPAPPRGVARADPSPCEGCRG